MGDTGVYILWGYVRVDSIPVSDGEGLEVTVCMSDD